MSESVKRVGKVQSDSSTNPAVPLALQGQAVARLGGPPSPVVGGDAVDIAPPARKPKAPPVGPNRPWNNDMPLRGSRNAHRTNTTEQIEEARHSKVHWFEGDLRSPNHPKQPLNMGHDDSEQGMPLSEWLKRGKASGRGLKLEMKDVQSAAEVDRILDEVEKSNQDGKLDQRLMFNMAAGNMERFGQQIAERFPGAILAITARQGELTPQEVRRLQDIPNGWDPRPKVTYVLNETQVARGLVHKLQQIGPVSIWNNVGTDLVSEDGQGSVDDRRRRLERMGVEGVIGLEPDKNFTQVALDKLGDLLGL